jgi:hypothetical protein
MKTKIKNVATWIITGLASLLTMYTAITKLLGSPSTVKSFTALGVGNYLIFLATMELVFLTLYLFRKTLKIGFLLIASYFAGALATHVSHGVDLSGPIIMLILFWTSAYLRKPDIFINPTHPKEVGKI